MKNNTVEIFKQDLIAALKNKESGVVLVLRSILASLQNEQIKIGKNKELTEENILTILTQEAKKRKDAIALYEQGGRPEKAENEKIELAIISKYLPEQLSEEDLMNIVKEAIKETSAQSIQDMGKVMGQVMQKVKGKADGSQVKNLVQSQLEK